MKASTVVQFYHPGGSHYIDFDALIVSSPEVCTRLRR